MHVDLSMYKIIVKLCILCEMQPLGLSGYDSYMYVSVLIAYQNINICGCNHTKLLMEYRHAQIGKARC